MRDLSELNINEGGRPVSRRPPSDEEIWEFAAAHDVELPDAYVELLKFANGGHPELDTFVPVGSDENDKWAVNRFYCLDAQADVDGLWQAAKEWAPVLGERRIPIAGDGGGNQIFLDFASNPPSVKLCIHDAQFKVRPIAESFEAFLDLLSEDPDMI